MALEAEIEALKSKHEAQERLLAEPHPRRMVSIYKLIAGIAEGHYKFKIYNARNPATSAIKSDLLRTSRELDEATILDILREAISHSA